MNPVAFKGLETDSRLFTSRVMSENNIKFMFTTAMHPQREFDNFLSMHGDAVRKVSLRCKDVKGIHAKAVAKGATSVKAPYEESEEGCGTIIRAILLCPESDVELELIDRSQWDTKKRFLPGYDTVPNTGPDGMPDPQLQFIDHLVHNYPLGRMASAAEWFFKHLDFFRFWNIDDTLMHTEYSALNSTVVSDWHEKVKMPINEPSLSARKKSQIQE